MLSTKEDAVADLIAADIIQIFQTGELSYRLV